MTNRSTTSLAEVAPTEPTEGKRARSGIALIDLRTLFIAKKLIAKGSVIFILSEQETLVLVVVNFTIV